MEVCLIKAVVTDRDPSEIKRKTNGNSKTFRKPVEFKSYTLYTYVYLKYDTFVILIRLTLDNPKKKKKRKQSNFLFLISNLVHFYST